MQTKIKASELARDERFERRSAEQRDCTSSLPGSPSATM